MFCQVLAGIRNFSSCIGTTTVTVQVFDATDTEIFKQDLKVKVKKNAADVTVTGIADGDKFSVGQTVDVTLPRAGVDTDERELTVDNAEIAEIKAGEKSRTYTVKFLKAGEATFTAKAYQSTKYPAATQSKTIKVTVGNPVPTEVKVVASNAFVLTFAEDVEALGLFKDVKEIPTDAIYYVINETKVSFSAVKAIKATGNTVKITTYDNFAAGTDYFVVVNGCEPLTFKLAGTAAKDVVAVEILTSTVTANTEADLAIALYNKDGIDIGPNVGYDYVTTSITDYTKASISGLKIFITNVGDAVDVKAEYKYYDTADNYKEISCDITKKVTAVAAPSDVNEGKVYTIEKNFDLGKLTKTYAGKNYIAVGDTGYTFSCKMFVKNNNQDRDILVKSNAANNSEKYAGQVLTVKIAEEKIAMIVGDDNAGKYGIVGNEVGSTNVFIGYYDNNNNWQTVAVCPIEVKAARYPNKLEATPNKTNLNLVGGDSITYKVKVFDQYNDLYIKEAAEYHFDQNSQSETNYAKCTIANGTTTNGETTFTVLAGNLSNFASNGQGGLKDSGSVNGTLKLTNGNSKANTVAINFSWANKGVAPTSIAFSNIKDATLDTSITANTNVKIASLQIMGKKDGYDTGLVALQAYVDKNGANKGIYLNAESDVPKVGSVSGAALCIAIRKDGNLIKLSDNAVANTTITYGDFIYTNGGTDAPVVTPIVDDGVYLYKMPKGTYTFTLYEVKNAQVQSPKVVTVTVTDNQQPATYKQIEEVTASANNPSDAIEVYFGSTKLTANLGFSCQPNDSAKTTYVKSASADLDVNFKVDNNAVGAFKYAMNVTVGKLLKVK